jgi:hypothetical protein
MSATVEQTEAVVQEPGKGYAVCERCERPMSPGGGCIPHAYSETEAGPPRPAQPYDGNWAGPTCHDCNAATGQPHHAGCDVERCPTCQGQALGCEHTAYEWVIEEVKP